VTAAGSSSLSPPRRVSRSSVDAHVSLARFPCLRPFQKIDLFPLHAQIALPELGRKLGPDDLVRLESSEGFVQRAWKLTDAQPPSLLFVEPGEILLDQGRLWEFVLEPAQAGEDEHGEGQMGDTPPRRRPGTRG
jgi:hypothetical protein